MNGAVAGLAPGMLGAQAAELAWQDAALCAQTDPEVFFPEKGGSTKEAKRVCVACPVRVECLTYALSVGERYGIYGGLSERERRVLARRLPGARGVSGHGDEHDEHDADGGEVAA